MQVPEQRHSAFAIHQGVDRVLEIDGVVFPKGTRFFPELVKGNLIFGTNEPMDAALKGITFPLPASGHASWPGSFFQ